MGSWVEMQLQTRVESSRSVEDLVEMEGDPKKRERGRGPRV